MLRSSIRNMEIVEASEGDSCSSCEKELDAGQLAIEGDANTLFCSLCCADRAISFEREDADMWRAFA